MNPLTPILTLQQEMKSDAEFERLCREAGLPWDFAGGFEPRWYNGPAPENVQVLFLMAEPGAITKNEPLNPPITNSPWNALTDSDDLHNYWKKNLYQLCQSIWPAETESMMDAHLAGSCTFWMSLPYEKQTGAVPKSVLIYFLETYLTRFLGLFPQAILLAAGSKAQQRLNMINTDFIPCSAFTRPEANKPRAKESWKKAGERVAEKLNPPDDQQGVVRLVQ